MTAMTTVEIPEAATGIIEPLQRLTRDLKDATATLSPNEARYLVDYYYLMQEDRKRAHNQVRAMGEDAEPHSLIRWLAENTQRLENNIKSALGAYSLSAPVGRWARSIVGVGPVIAAGFMAHIDIAKAPTASNIWRFAGLDPTVKWLGKDGARDLMGQVASIAEPWYDVASEEDAQEIDDYAMTPGELEQYLEIITEPSANIELNSRQLVGISRLTNRKFTNLLRLARDKDGRVTTASMTAALAKRPYNAKLKVLCWHLGESFVKWSNHTSDVYGSLYVQKKLVETERNEAGLFAEQAEEKLRRFKIGRDTDAYAAYSQGRLPPAHIHARAKRVAVKMFLAHYQQVAYEVHHGEPPPRPYVLEHDEHSGGNGQHAHMTAPPNWPMTE